MQYPQGMAKMIQIRNVPEEMHTELKVRAARSGMSLSDFLKTELQRMLQRKSLADVFAEMEPYRVPLETTEVVEAIEADRRDRR